MRCLVDDAPHVRNEAHVEHAVGLVDHQHLDAAQIDDAAVDEIEQSARCRDEYVDGTFGQLQALLVEVHAADDADHHRVHVFGEIAAVLFDLNRQFARRSEHQRARRAGRVGRRLRVFPLSRENRHQKRRRFAGAGLCLPGHVVVGQAVGQHFALNRRAVLETEIGDGVHDRQRQREVVKAIAVLDLWYRKLIECPG